MLKFIAACVLAIGMLNTCFAYEYDVKLLKKENKVKNGTVWEVVANDLTQAMTKENCSFENDIIKVQIDPAIYVSFDNYSGHMKNIPEDIISGNEGFGLGKMHIEAKYGYLDLILENKTDKVMEVNLDKCSFTLDEYSGRLVRGEVLKIDSGSVTQAPLIIAPKAKVSAQLYIPVGPDQSQPRVKLNKNILSSVVISANDNYVVFAPSIIIDSSKLHWEKVSQ